MATEQANTLTYLPNRTLGRSGYQAGASDQLGETLEHLDALLTLIAYPSEGRELNDFQTLNNEIQLAALNLASRLAFRAHELHEQLQVESTDSIMPA